MTVDSHYQHGLFATFTAMLLPPALTSLIDRWAFAVAVGLTSTLASKIISALWERFTRPKPNK